MRGPRGIGGSWRPARRDGQPDGSRDSRAHTSRERSRRPEIALEFPETLRALHVDIQRAGSDIIIGETFCCTGETLAALEIGKASGPEVVLTLAPRTSRRWPTA